MVVEKLVEVEEPVEVEAEELVVSHRDLIRSDQILVQMLEK